MSMAPSTPVISQQGSRAGLITALVLAIMVGLTTIITTFYWNSQWQDEHKRLLDFQKKYAEVSSAGDLSNPDVMAAVQDKGSLLGDRSTAIEAVIEQRSRLVQVICGRRKNEPDAEADARTTVNNAAAFLAADPYKLQVTTDSLISAVKNLMNIVQDRESQRAAAVAQSAQMISDRDAAIATFKDALAKRDAAVDEVRKELADAGQKFRDTLADKDQQIAAMGDRCAAQVKEAEDNVQKVEVENHRLSTIINTKQRLIDQLTSKLAEYRFDVTKPVLIMAKGKILRVPSPGLAYIDLGASDHVPLGLTFEVYDKNMGVAEPGNGVSDEVMPVGKASIEVIKIGQNSSECRVTHVQPGETITEGDLIANLVYNRLTHYNFYVYGDFDPDLSGIWTPQKAEVIRNLVLRWGGNVVDHISPDVDFVVVGKEPVIPDYSKDDLQGSPLLLANYNSAVAALADYDKVLSEARDLHIPVMNQNRFYYYTGFFDIARR